MADLEKNPDDSGDRDNLANIAHGASIAWRTGESTLDSSPAQAIDGDPSTAWLTPMYDPEQAAVVALPSRTRVEQLGAKRTASARAGTRALRIERSLDGVHFEPFTTLKLADTSAYQVTPVTPAEALYLRVTLEQPTGPFVQLNSFIARGKPLEPIAPRTIGGCWAINGGSSSAALVQHGGTISGTLAGVAVDGGSDGRSFRFAWTRGPQFGVGVATITPDGRHLSAITWYEEAYPLNLSGSWFGEQAPCSTKPVERPDVFQTYMSRFGHVPLYGLGFDGEGRLAAGSEPAVERLVQFLAANPRTLWNLVNHGDPRQLASLRAALG
ncbi:MAG: hypothetical protein JWO56_1844, partial [Acidobacteria bacterium]|nr:hypothetical protein [Acidobacteriota bacterium]